MRSDSHRQHCQALSDVRDYRETGSTVEARESPLPEASVKTSIVGWMKRSWSSSSWLARCSSQAGCTCGLAGTRGLIWPRQRPSRGATRTARARLARKSCTPASSGCTSRSMSMACGAARPTGRRSARSTRRQTLTAAASSTSRSSGRHVNTHACTYVRACLRTCLHTCLHVCLHACLYV